MRALNGSIVEYSFTKKINYKKGQESEIKDISKSIDMDIQYS